MKSIKRRLSQSIRRSGSSFVDESISELGENEVEDEQTAEPAKHNSAGLGKSYSGENNSAYEEVASYAVVKRFSDTRNHTNKRFSLPTSINLPAAFLRKHTANGDAPITRRMRRASMSEIGFGKLESYVKLNKLGEGTYAKVFKGKSKLTNDLVALKEIRLEHEEGAPCTAIREASLLKDLKQANIVTLHDIIHTNDNLVLVFEYLDRDLKQYMSLHDNILSMHNIKIFLFQLLRGIEYCHRKSILHRDLKPQNLLINELGELKLADFGLARAKSVPTKTYSNEVVTLWYRPPDVLLGSTDYDGSIDIWGVGCIFCEMVTGQPLFPGSTVADQLAIIFKTLGTPTEEMWKGVSHLPDYKNYSARIYPGESFRSIAPRLELDGIGLISKLLEYNPNERISAEQALHHYFFDCFGPNIFKIPDTTSIFTLSNVKMTENPGRKMYENGRRQSMFF